MRQLRQPFFSKWAKRYFKMGKYLKVGQKLFQSGAVTSKWVKMLFQVGAIISRWGITLCETALELYLKRDLWVVIFHFLF